jgi:hypothetical protein
MGWVRFLTTTSWSFRVVKYLDISHFDHFDSKESL